MESKDAREEDLVGEWELDEEVDEEEPLANWKVALFFALGILILATVFSILFPHHGPAVVRLYW